MGVQGSSHKGRVTFPRWNRSSNQNELKKREEDPVRIDSSAFEGGLTALFLHPLIEYPHS